MQLKLYYCALIILHVQSFIIKAKHIKGPPIIREHPKSIVARRNEPLTLNCAVSGAEDISWFRNGERVISTRQNGNSHRIVLSDGSLFFLRVTNNKRDSDAGIYWCVAGNRRGKVRSRNATLSVAFLEEFYHEEAIVVAVIGSKAVLRCYPPNGLPNPRVRWKHRNSIVDYDNERYPNPEGDLIFESVMANDAGEYYCEASNLAGSHKSPKITLEIKDHHLQPIIRTKIGNIHEKVILPCNSYGKNVTNVTWKKRDGKIPFDRSQIVRKHSLQISNLEFSDSGEYFCESVGNHGTNMVAVVLKVYQKLEISHRSPAQLVLDGKTFNVTCNITGNPKPILIWKIPSEKSTASYLLSGQSKGMVTSDNSHLIVNNSGINNSGTYTCWGINFSSAVSAKSSVTVLKKFPPPLMGTKPQDLRRREGSTATFPCEADSEYLPASITWWYRNDKAFRDVKVEPTTYISILPIGALVIRNVSISHAGTYTCEVASEAGNVKEESLLIIDNLVIGSHPSRYVPMPAPPSKPVATSVTDSSIHLSWMPNSKRSLQENITYSIEMWTSPWPQWKSVLAGVIEEFSHIIGLRPNSPYFFVVKTINKYGSESFPSPWSDVIFTSSGEVVDLDDQKYIRWWLAKIHLILFEAKKVSATNIDLLWDIDGEMKKQINTFAVYLIEGSEINRIVVFGSSFSYRLTNIRPNSKLTIFITPIIGSEEGTPSNYIAVDSGYINDIELMPRKIKATDFASGFIITWKEPSASEFHTNIIGYKVLIISNETTTNYITNETSIKFNPKYNFSVQVAVVSETGLGPWSELKSFHVKSCCEDGETMPAVLYSPFHPAWFLYLLIPTGIFVIVLSCLYLRYVRQKSAPPCDAQVSAPVYYSDAPKFNQRGKMNIYDDKKSWRPDPDPRPVQLLKAIPIVAEYAEPRCRYDDTEPYATTALLSPYSNHIASHYHQKREPERKLSVNWSSLLPPPPQEPPPTELANWNSCKQGEGCDRCCIDDSVYQHPCNVVSSMQPHYIVPNSQFTRFSSLQMQNKQESFILEAKSSTH